MSLSVEDEAALQFKQISDIVSWLDCVVTATMIYIADRDFDLDGEV